MLSDNDDTKVFDDMIDILVAIISKELNDKEEVNDGT